LGIAEQFIAGEFHRANFVLAAFVDNNADDQSARRGMLELDILDVKIDEALVPIKFRELLLVIFELLVLENAAARRPGKHPMPPGLDLLAKGSLAEGRRIYKYNVGDSDLRTFSDRKCSRRAAGALLDGDGIRDRRAGIASLLIHLLDFLAVGEKFYFIER